MKKRMARILRIRVMACVLSLAMALSFTLPAIAVAAEFSDESTTTAAAEYVPAPIVEEVADEKAADEEVADEKAAESVEPPDEAVLDEDAAADLVDAALNAEPEVESDEEELSGFELLASLGNMLEWVAVRPQIFAGTDVATGIPSPINGDVYFFFFHRAHLTIVGDTVTNYREAFNIPPVNLLRDFRPAPQTDWVDGIVLNNSLHPSDTNSLGLPIWDVTILNQPASTSVPCAVCGENPSICPFITQANAVQSTLVFPGSAANQTLYLDIRVVAVPNEAPSVLGGAGYLTTLLPAEIAADYIVFDYELDYIAGIARTNDTWALTLYLAPLQGGGGQGPTRTVEFTVWKFPHGSTNITNPVIPAYAVQGATFSFDVPLTPMVPDGTLYHANLNIEFLRSILPPELIAHFDGVAGFDVHPTAIHTALVMGEGAPVQSRIILIGQEQLAEYPTLRAYFINRVGNEVVRIGELPPVPWTATTAPTLEDIKPFPTGIPHDGWVMGDSDYWIGQDEDDNWYIQVYFVPIVGQQPTPVTARIDFCYGITPGPDGVCRQHDLAAIWLENTTFVPGQNIYLAKVLELIREHTGFTGEGFGAPMFKLWTDDGDIRLPGVAYLTWEQVFVGFDEYFQDYMIDITVFFPMLETQPPPPVPCDLCGQYPSICCDVCERHPCICGQGAEVCDDCKRYPCICDAETEVLERERPERPRPGDGARRAAEGPKTGDSNNVFAQMAVMALVVMTIAGTGLIRTREQS